MAETINTTSRPLGEIPVVMHRYGVDDAESDTRHLAHLLDVAFDTLLSIDFAAAPGERHALERLNALLWIARDRAEMIRDGLSDAPRDYLLLERERAAA